MLINLSVAVPLLYWPAFHLVGATLHRMCAILFPTTAAVVCSVTPAADLNYHINGNLFNDATILLLPSLAAASVVLAVAYALLSPRLSPPGEKKLRTASWITAVALAAAAIPIAAILLGDAIARGRFS